MLEKKPRKPRGIPKRPKPKEIKETKPIPSSHVDRGDGVLLFKPGHSVGRPAGSKNKAKLYAEAMMGYNGNKVVREILRKALDPNDKDQGMMLKMCLERILPPVREVNIRNNKQLAINVVVEGVQSFIKDVVDAEILSEIDEEELEVEGQVTEEEYKDIIMEDEDAPEER